MTADPTPEQIRAFLADCNLRRHGWSRFQQGTRRSALRLLGKTTREQTTPRTDANRPA